MGKELAKEVQRANPRITQRPIPGAGPMEFREGLLMDLYCRQAI